nr:MAG TPA: hypothetical protein [Caudoviricetes sp.]
MPFRTSQKWHYSRLLAECVKLQLEKTNENTI